MVHDYLIGICHKLILILLLLVCGLFAKKTLASGAEQNRAVRSWSSIGAHSPSGAEKIFSSTDTDMWEVDTKRPAYRSIHSTGASRALTNIMPFPVNYCGRVERIDPVVLSVTGNDHANSMIAGTIAIPVGRRGAGFFTDIAVPENIGYTPFERNIIEPIHYQISLIVDDGGRYVITQKMFPKFEPGEIVRLNSDGFLEKGDCVGYEPGKTGIRLDE